jgi:predicted O-methyltransferase YrrM
MNPKELHECRWRSFENLLAYVCQTKKPKRILEWGPGRSTKCILANAPDCQILTIEHDQKWFNKAKAQFGTHPQVDLQHRVISMKGGQSTGYINYPIWRAIQDGHGLNSYDLIFVDGRSRFDCLVAAKLLLKDDGVVILHDAHRANYMPAVESFSHHRVFGELRTAMMTKQPMDFMDGFSQEWKPEFKTKVLSNEDTIADLRQRILSGKPFAYLRFGDADLFFIDDPNFDKNRRHDRNPAMSKELGVAFSIEHPDYLIGCVAGGKVCGSKESRLIEIAGSYHMSKTYYSAVALQVLYMKDPEGFVQFCKECFWGKRVLFIGGESVARNELVRKAFHVVATIEFTDRNAYRMLDAKMPQIEKNIPKFDIVVSALGQATRVLGARLWQNNLRTQYFDVGSVVDALANRPLRSWIKRCAELLPKYKQAFED